MSLRVRGLKVVPEHIVEYLRTWPALTDGDAPGEDALMAMRAGTTRSPESGTPCPPGRPGVQTHLRMALNLLTDDPTQPSGAHWCWTRIVPEMANRLLPG